MKRIVSIILTLCLLLGNFAPVAHAQEIQPDALVQTDGITVQGTNGFGTMLSAEIQEAQEENAKAYEGGYTVTDLVIEGSTAKVRFDVLGDANLVVALYTEDGVQMLASANTLVSAEDEEATLTFTGEMPEYFMASAYLVDTYDFSPLSDSYDTPMYTREMQELLASTVADYDADRVLQLTEDENTNFAVYAEEVICIEGTDETNTVVSADDENLIYVIENADSQISGLANGDVFALPYGENELLIVKVASVSANGATVTITGEELEMEEAFSHLKIESDAITTDFVVEEGTGDDGVTYEGVSAEGDADSVNTPVLYGAEGDVIEAKLSHAFKLDKTLFSDKSSDGDLGTEVKVTGSLKFSLSLELEYYISTSEQYIKLVVKAGAELAANVSGELSMNVLQLPSLRAAVILGLSVELKPRVEIQISAEYELKLSYNFAIGFAYGNKIGSKDLSEKPDISSKIDFEGSFFFGVDLNPHVKVLGGLVVDASLTGLVGLEFKGEMDSDDYEEQDRYPDDGTIHQCVRCLNGELNAKFEVKVKLKFLKSKALTLDLKILTLTFKITDLYYSFDRSEFGLGKCPHKTYRVTLSVGWTGGLKEIPIYIVGASGEMTELGRTNDRGFLDSFLPKGTYRFAALPAEGNHLIKNVKISGACKVVIDEITTSASANQYLSGVEAEDYVDLGHVIASGECGAEGSNITWNLTAGGTFTITGKGRMADYGQYAPPWYDYREQVKSIVVTDGVENLCNFAFHGMENAESAIIANSVNDIGYSAFVFCKKLKEVKIPDGVTMIDDYMFFECTSLTNVLLPFGIEEICYSAFSGCESLTEIDIPDSVTIIDDSAFYHSGIAEVNFGFGVTSIGGSAFAGTNLTDVRIPDNVTTIDDHAFNVCGELVNVSIGSGTSSIGVGVFMGCRNLEGIWVDNDNPYFSNNDEGILFNKDQSRLIQAPGALYGDYHIPANVHYIEEEAFCNCMYIRNIYVHQGVAEICDQAFSACWDLTGLWVDSANPYYCNDVQGVLYSKDQTTLVQAPCTISGVYTIPDSVVILEEAAFNGCNLTNVTIPWSVTNIGDCAFIDCNNLTEITIPGSVINFGSGVFIDCRNLTSVTILDGVTGISSQAFDRCRSLTSITIPASVVYIDYMAFMECDNLTDVYYAGSRTDWNAIVIEDDNEPLLSAAIHYNSAGPDAAQAMEMAVIAPEHWGAHMDRPVMPTPPVDAVSGKTPTIDAVYGGEYSTEETESYTLKRATFTGLVPGAEYLLLAMANSGTSTPLDPDNLLCIDQATAGADGTLTFTYAQRVATDPSYVVACGAASRSLADATITFPDMIADGEIQAVEPSVVYGGKTLKEGIDYEITGTVSYTEAGTYVCYIRGIRNYTGTMQCTYTVTSDDPCADGHTERIIPGVDATCTEPGLTEGSECEVCGLVLVEQVAVEALGHDWVDADCETPKTCARCGETEGEALGHTWDEGIVTVEPTEETEGEMTYTCTVCGATRTESIPAIDHEHRYEAVVTPPTCMEQGYTTHTCRCGDSCVDSYVDALGHDMSEWATETEATCTEDGVERRECSRCEHSETQTIPAPGHDYDSVVTDPTCTDAGFTTHTCTRCEDTVTDSPVDALGHQWDDGVVTVEPTEESEGERLYTCERCGETKTEVIPELDHTHNYESAVTEPTCTEQGYTTHTCRCGDSYVDTFVDALGHDWVDADCETPKTCTRCRETKGETLGHDWQDADCENAKTCTRCEASEGEALGHDWQNATCTESETCSRCEATRGEPAGHNYVDGECIDCGEEDPDYEPEEPTEPSEPTVPEGIRRYAGADRYLTAISVANQLKANLGVEKFASVVVAYGQNFPDALSGSYLAYLKNAPILLTQPSAESQMLSYIEENLVPGGTAYLLGDTGVVPESFEDGLAERGFWIIRLAGPTRYETNMEILREAGIGVDQPVLIATGKNYADSLSASATGLPILLVDKKLSETQKEFLRGTSGEFVILGGYTAVSQEVEDELSGLGTVTRVKGANRYETSVEIAKYFFDNPESVVLSYAQGFPDGLCGGPLALSMGAPLILTTNESHGDADAYIEGIISGAVTGGSDRVSDDTVREIFDLSENALIIEPFLYQGHTYCVFNDSRIETWEDAQAYCESLGGYLAVISSQEENDALYAYIQSQKYDLVYFGYSDAGHEGEWHWVSQESSAYTNWHAGQPNDGVNGNYAQFVSQFSDGPGNGEWSDGYYGGQLGYAFICEWPDAV